MAACAQPSPATPPTSSSGAQTITGTEHLAWDQQAGSAAQLATFKYLIYVDGVATEAPRMASSTPASTMRATRSVPPTSDRSTEKFFG
jgi:hypothetical protein